MDIQCSLCVIYVSNKIESIINYIALLGYILYVYNCITKPTKKFKTITTNIIIIDFRKQLKRITMYKI